MEDDELKKECLTVIIDDMQDKYFERLERMDKEHNKTIKVCFTWVAILACVWTIGYFIVGNEFVLDLIVEYFCAFVALLHFCFKASL